MRAVCFDQPYERLYEQLFRDEEVLWAGPFGPRVRADYGNYHLM